MTAASDRDGEPTASSGLEAEVLRVGARTAGEDGILVAVELRLENTGAATRIGGWAVRVRLTDGTTAELALRDLPEPATFAFPRDGERTVDPASVLRTRAPERTIGPDEELVGMLVCETGGLEQEELLGNGVLYTVRFRDAEGGELEVRRLLSVGPVGGDAAGYFPGLAGT